MVKKYDFSDPDFFENGFPYSTLDWLEQDRNILNQNHRMTDELFWFALGYDSVKDISSDFHTFSSAEKTILVDTPEGEELKRQQNFLLNMDPPRHKRVREIFGKAFTVNNVKIHEQMIKGVVDRVFESIEGKSEIEVIRDFSTPIALEVICRIVGINTDDMDFINDASNSMVYTDDPDFSSDKDQGKYSTAMLFYYGMKLYDNRDKVEKGTLLDILCNTLDDGERLSQDEFCFFFVFILAAGYETTRSMISNMLRMISVNVFEFDVLRKKPDLMENAVEEFLRYDPPVFQMCRTATKDVEIGGCPITKGGKIGLLYPAANRDPNVFAEPNRFDLERENAKKHLSFGVGRHHCLGASLARLELKIVLEKLLQRYDAIELIELKRVRSNFINSIKSMKIRLKHLEKNMHK